MAILLAWLPVRVWSAGEAIPTEVRRALESCAVLFTTSKDIDTVMGLKPATICGSGIVIARSGRILTNIHVARPLFAEVGAPGAEAVAVARARLISRTETFAVATGKSDSVRADVTALDVLFTKTPGIARFRTLETLQRGERLHTLGNRSCAGWVYSAGSVHRILDPASDSDPAAGKRELNQINTLIRQLGVGPPEERYDQLLMTSRGFLNHGNSGGPVVDDDGRLVGMALGSVDGYGLVIPLKPLMKAIGRSESKTSPPVGPGRLPLQEQSTVGTAESRIQDEADIRAIFERMDLTLRE